MLSKTDTAKRAFVLLEQLKDLGPIDKAEVLQITAAFVQIELGREQRASVMPRDVVIQPKARADA